MVVFLINISHQLFYGFFVKMLTMRKLNFLSMLKKMIIRKDGAHMPMYRHTAKKIFCACL